ncbi:MAG: hypothetical protein AAFX79_04360 [Planctomycetota bacterium]
MIRLAVACALAAACGAPLGCGGRTVVIADAPPVDVRPVTDLAGHGCEIRVWAIESQRRSLQEQNASLAELWDQWRAYEESRGDEELSEDDAAAASIASDVGPFETAEGERIASFEQFVDLMRDAGGESRALPESPADLALAFDPIESQLWRANGLRLLLVPLDELSSVREGLGVDRPLERTWIGEATSWTHVARGPAGGPRTLRGDLGPIDLPAGSMALLGRLWAAPGLAGPVLRVEMVPQFVPVRGRAVRGGGAWTTRERPEDADAGPVFDRLVLEGAIPPGHALVIVPDRGPPDAAAPRVGPVVPRSRLGPEILRRRGGDGLLRGIALVLVPVLPEQWDLSRPWEDAAGRAPVVR